MPVPTDNSVLGSEAQTACPCPAQILTTAQRSKALHAAARYGNYHSYYSRFREQNVPDTRLSIVPSTLLHDARVLDLGCNAGKLTLEVLDHFGAKEAIGVDIDPFLVNQASALCPNRQQVYLRFEVLDIMDFTKDGSWNTSSTLSTREYDIVFLFSITKWLHLNHGDEALLELFGRIHGLLAIDGYLVVEPQGWDNYGRAVKKNPMLRPMYKEIRLRPPFKEELEAAGFIRVIDVERDEVGFERSIHIWKRLNKK